MLAKRFDARPLPTPLALGAGRAGRGGVGNLFVREWCEHHGPGTGGNNSTGAAGAAGTGGTTGSGNSTGSAGASGAAGATGPSGGGGSAGGASGAAGASGSAGGGGSATGGSNGRGGATGAAGTSGSAGTTGSRRRRHRNRGRGGRGGAGAAGATARGGRDRHGGRLRQRRRDRRDLHHRAGAAVQRRAGAEPLSVRLHLRVGTPEPERQRIAQLVQLPADGRVLDRVRRHAPTAPSRAAAAAPGCRAASPAPTWSRSTTPT